jgi:hypothetical protein
MRIVGECEVEMSEVAEFGLQGINLIDSQNIERNRRILPKCRREKTQVNTTTTEGEAMKIRFDIQVLVNELDNLLGLVEEARTGNGQERKARNRGTRGRRVERHEETSE